MVIWVKVSNIVSMVYFFRLSILLVNRDIRVLDMVVFWIDVGMVDMMGVCVVNCIFVVMYCIVICGIVYSWGFELLSFDLCISVMIVVLFVVEQFLLIELDCVIVVCGQVKVLYGFSLCIVQGQYIVLFGFNGCGKLIFIKLIICELYLLVQVDGFVVVRVLGQNCWQVDWL